MILGSDDGMREEPQWLPFILGDSRLILQSQELRSRTDSSSNPDCPRLHVLGQVTYNSESQFLLRQREGNCRTHPFGFL